MNCSSLLSTVSNMPAPVCGVFFVAEELREGCLFGLHEKSAGATNVSTTSLLAVRRTETWRANVESSFAKIISALRT